MQFISLGSGSSGNCYYISHGDDAILIDCGITLRNFKHYAKQYGLNISHIRAIIVTHDHTDHVKSVGALSQEFHIPVYSTETTHKGLSRNRFVKKKVPQNMVNIVTYDEELTIGNFIIKAFNVPHDSAQNSGYLIHTSQEETCLCFLTDVGSITPDIEKAVHAATHLIIEANYDEAMLATGPYPPILRRRIAGPYGHQSNDDCANLIIKQITPRLRNIWLCHLSEENNNPTIAQRTVSDALAEALTPEMKMPSVVPLPRREPSGFFILEAD